MNTLTIIIIIIVILIFCGLISYYYIKNLNNINKYKLSLITTETIFDNDYEYIIKMNNLVTRPTLYVPKLGYGISFMWEMYIPNLGSNANWGSSFNILKSIIAMNDSPQILYHPKNNYLSIILKYRDSPFYSQFAEIKYNNIKQQKWCKYILIINGRNIQLNIDGTMVLSQYLPSVPVIYDINSDIKLGSKNNNFLGKIRNLNLIPFPISINEL